MCVNICCCDAFSLQQQMFFDLQLTIVIRFRFVGRPINRYNCHNSKYSGPHGNVGRSPEASSCKFAKRTWQDVRSYPHRGGKSV